MTIQLPKLPFEFGALEPIVSARTMRIHHGRHHAKYVAAVNDLIEGGEEMTLEDIIGKARVDLDMPLVNNAGQAWNHAFLWNCLTPASAEPVAGLLYEAIRAQFGDMAGLRKAAHKAGAAHFGSGWVWLSARGETLSVTTTHDGDTLAGTESIPLLVCDLWEHAYYLDFQNDRGSYLSGFWEGLANWSFAEAQFTAANGDGAAWSYAEGSRPQPLNSHADFESAIKEVAGALVVTTEPDAVDDQRLGALLGQIADYRRAPSQPLLAEDLNRLHVLDEHLKAYGVRWPARRRADAGEHWAPALGGDLGFHH